MTKVKQLNSILASAGLSRCYTIETEEEAIDLVQDIIEGEFDPRTEWGSALEYFADILPSFVRHHS